MENINKVSVITGSASGIGREVAILFAKRGYTVACTDINKDLLNQTVSDIKKDGGKAYGILADITKVSDIKNLANEINKRFGKINVLINCAGVIVGIHELVDYKEEDMDLILDVNLKGTYRCCKYLLPLIVRHSNSIIINISSQSGKYPEPRASIYAATKAAIINFTESLGVELIKDGIKVAVINPGMVDTPIHNQKEEKYDKKFSAKFLNPIDVAKACFFVVEQSENCLVKELDIIPMSQRARLIID